MFFLFAFMNSLSALLGAPMELFTAKRVVVWTLYDLRELISESPSESWHFFLVTESIILLVAVIISGLAYAAFNPSFPQPSTKITFHDVTVQVIILSHLTAWPPIAYHALKQELYKMRLLRSDTNTQGG